MSFEEDVNQSLADVSAEHDANLIIYAGEIGRRGADLIARAVTQRSYTNVVLLLCTLGGDPHAAFKIARICQTAFGTVPEKRQYKLFNDPRFLVYVPTLCKSAGTIIALGADEILMADNAELGPIDIQLRKPEEVGELTSTLTPIQAIQSLRRHLSQAFTSTFSELRFDEQLAFSTKMAGEIARDLTGSIGGPIAAQIDPLRLAETERLLKISSEYGERLNEGIQNLRPGALSKLLSGYPSHSFVIDRREAGTLFHKVSRPSHSLERIGGLLSFLYSDFADKVEPYVHLVKPLNTSGVEDEKSNPAGLAKDGSSVENAESGGSEIQSTAEGKNAYDGENSRGSTTSRTAQKRKR